MSRTERQNHPSHRAYATAHEPPPSRFRSPAFEAWLAEHRAASASPTAHDGKALKRYDLRDRRGLLRLVRHRRAHFVRIGDYDQAGPERAIRRPIEP